MLKKLLSEDDLTTNYLIYSPCVYNRPDDNWLLDVELCCGCCDEIQIFFSELSNEEIEEVKAEVMQLA